MKRPLHLAVQELTRELGGPSAVARRIGISEGHVYRYGQDPNGSGKDIPLRSLMELLAATADAPLNLKYRTLAREIAAYITSPAGLHLRTENALEELRYVIDLLEQRAGLPPAVKPYHCPECGEQLKVEAFVSGVPVFGKCTGKRHQNMERKR